MDMSLHCGPNGFSPAVPPQYCGLEVVDVGIPQPPEHNPATPPAHRVDEPGALFLVLLTAIVATRFLRRA